MSKKKRPPIGRNHAAILNTFVADALAETQRAGGTVEESTSWVIFSLRQAAFTLEEKYREINGRLPERISIRPTKRGDNLR